MLRRVRQLEKKLQTTDTRLPAVREVLARFLDKLSQAQGFLQEADTNVHETHDRNRANRLKVQRSQVSPGQTPSPPGLASPARGGQLMSWRFTVKWLGVLDGWMIG